MVKDVDYSITGGVGVVASPDALATLAKAATVVSTAARGGASEVVLTTMRRTRGNTSAHTEHCWWCSSCV